MKFLKNKKGFSLVELLVVITIIAILSVAAFSALGGNTVKARDSKRQQDLGTIQSALELYYVEFANYPTALVSGENTGSPDTGLIPRKYLSIIPTDPSDDTLDYYFWSDGNAYVLGTVLENDGGTQTAYVVGNSDGGEDNTGVGNCDIRVGDTACLPYDLP